MGLISLSLRGSQEAFFFFILFLFFFFIKSIRTGIGLQAAVIFLNPGAYYAYLSLLLLAFGQQSSVLLAGGSPSVSLR